MAKEEKVEGHPRNILAADFSEVESSYGNQSIIQRTNEDIAVVFGQTTMAGDGKVKIKFQNEIHMSYNHFKNFVKNCNNILEEIEKNEAKQ